MTYEMKLQEERKQGHKEGLAEGLEKGMKKGMEKGMETMALQVALDGLHDKLPLRKIMQYTKLPKERIIALANEEGIAVCDE